MTFDQREEVRRRVAAQRRLGEMGVGREIAVWRGVDVGEIAAAAAGDQDLLAGLVGVIEDEEALTALPGRRRAHEARSASAEDDGVKLIGCGRQDQPAESASMIWRMGVRS